MGLDLKSSKFFNMDSKYNLLILNKNFYVYNKNNILFKGLEALDMK